MIKYFIFAIFCCSVAFCQSEPDENQFQSTWRSFLLSHTIDPSIYTHYKNWTARTWFIHVKLQDLRIKRKCPTCESILNNQMLSIFVASKKDIIDAFSRNSSTLNETETAWSNKRFRTYALFNGSVYDCGKQYVYAQLNEDGLPTDLLQTNVKRNHLNSSGLNVTIECSNIEISKSKPELEEIDDESEFYDESVDFDFEQGISEIKAEVDHEGVDARRVKRQRPNYPKPGKPWKPNFPKPGRPWNPKPIPHPRI